MNGSATRREAKEFWSMVQELKVAKPRARQIQPGTSCSSCGHFRNRNCRLKMKMVMPYNVCAEWKTK